MNRAIAALAVFALLFAAGLFALRAWMPAPEVVPGPELFPASTFIYFEVRNHGEVTPWTRANAHELAAALALPEPIPGVSAALAAGLPQSALAAGAFVTASGAIETMLALETRAPADAFATLASTIRSLPGGVTEVEQQVLRARWTRFDRADAPPILLYAGRATAAASRGETLARLLGGKRHGAASLADNPELAPARARMRDPGLFLWIDGDHAGPARAGRPVLARVHTLMLLVGEHEELLDIELVSGEDASAQDLLALDPGPGCRSAHFKRGSGVQLTVACTGGDGLLLSRFLRFLALAGV